MASLPKAVPGRRTGTAVALLGRDDGARAQLRQSLEDLGASVVFEGDTAGTVATDVLERAPRVVIVNLADNADDDLDHLQDVFDAPDVDVVFNESGVSSRLQGWDLARWARHLAAKVLGETDVMPPPPPGAEALPIHDLMPTAGKPPTPAQMARERPIEEFVMEAEDRVDALPEDFLPLAPSAPDVPPMQRDTSLDVDFGAVDDAMLDAAEDAPPVPAPAIVRVERMVEEHDLPDFIPLPDLGELDRALEAEAQAVATNTRSDRELLDEALGGLDLDFVLPAAPQGEPGEEGGEAGAADAVDAGSQAIDASAFDFDEHDAAASDAATFDGDMPDSTTFNAAAFDAATLEDDTTGTSTSDAGAFDPSAFDAFESDAQPLSDADAEELEAALREAAAFDDGSADDGTAAPADARVPPTAAAPAAPVVPFGGLFLEGEAETSAARAAVRDEWSLTEDDDAAPAPAPAPVAATQSDATTPDVPDDWALEADAADAGPPIEGRAVFLVPGVAPDAVEVEEIDMADVASDFGFSLETDLPDDVPETDAPRAAPSWVSDDGDLQFDDAGLDDDVAALAAQLDAMEDAAPRFEAPQDDRFSIAPLDDTDEDAPAAPPAASAAPATAAPAANIDFGSLELTSLDAEIESAPRVAAASNFDFSNLANLSLEPIEDEEGEGSEAAAAAAASANDPLLMAMGLVDAPAKVRAVPGEIPRVIVLGASIGGPDALRTFLGGIPAGFPALFLLVQHLENGYFERLAQQLQKATKLNVRALGAEAAADAQSGDVLVIPADARYTIERNGVVASTAHAAPPHYTPCIDDVIRDAADRFGAQTTVLIFSGMAGDAIEGAVYATAKGAQVWVQDPASCVVSSMVDGAKSRGVVEFIGSPRELADHCVALYGK